MNNEIQIFVRLLDEDVDVWRPILAEHRLGSLYRIVEQPYDEESEKWEFRPGRTVVCEQIETSEGRILAAIREAGDDDWPT
jgi:hypothetical protein